MKNHPTYTYIHIYIDTYIHNVNNTTHECKHEYIDNRRQIRKMTVIRKRKQHHTYRHHHHSYTLSSTPNQHLPTHPHTREYKHFWHLNISLLSDLNACLWFFIGSICCYIRILHASVSAMNTLRFLNMYRKNYKKKICLLRRYIISYTLYTEERRRRTLLLQPFNFHHKHNMASANI